jgi:hypothetical protein
LGGQPERSASLLDDMFQSFSFALSGSYFCDCVCVSCGSECSWTCRSYRLRQEGSSRILAHVVAHSRHPKASQLASGFTFHPLTYASETIHSRLIQAANILLVFRYFLIACTALPVTCLIRSRTTPSSQPPGYLTQVSCLPTNPRPLTHPKPPSHSKHFSHLEPLSLS